VLVALKASVSIESGAGWVGATDDDYRAAGASVSRIEIVPDFSRPSLTVNRPAKEDLDNLKTTRWCLLSAPADEPAELTALLENG